VDRAEPPPDRIKRQVEVHQFQTLLDGHGDGSCDLIVRQTNILEDRLVVEIRDLSSETISFNKKGS
jgi:hypothetical protein